MDRVAWRTSRQSPGDGRGETAAASAASVNRALAAGTPESLLGAFAELLAAHGPSAPGADVTLRGHVAVAAAVRRAGGLWRADEAQAALGVTRATLQTWRDRRKVLALSFSDGSCGYPIAQFARPANDLGRPRPLAGLAPVLAAAGDRLAAEELVDMLAFPQPALGDVHGTPRSGFEALAAGEDALVLAYVTHVVTPADEGAPLAA